MKSHMSKMSSATMTKRSASCISTTSPMFSLFLFWLFSCTILTRLHVGTCGQIPSRFFYENQEQNAETSSADGGGGSATTADDADEPNEIPLEFYKQLDNVTNLAEFIEMFVDKDKIDPQLGLQENLKRNVERANFIIPKPVSCQPVSTIIPLTPINTANDNKLTTYYPSCTTVMRCSDCCDTQKVVCEPTETEELNFQVYKYVYGRNQFMGREIIPVQQHLSCAIQCRTKAEDCKSYHIYKPETCSCVCQPTANNERKECTQHGHKIWDEQFCRCLCRENISCTTGTIFDEKECKCIKSGAKNSDANPLTPEQRRRFIVKAVPIDPDDSTLYSV